MAETIYVGVGCTVAQQLPFEVLKHTIVINTFRRVEVIPLCDEQLGTPHVCQHVSRVRHPSSVSRVDLHRRKCTLVTSSYLCPEFCSKETQRWLAWQEKRCSRPTRWPLST